MAGHWPRGGGAYWRTTWSIWAVAVSWLFAPFWFNPLGFEVTQNLAHKEIANGRLAMIAVAGFIVQGLTTHESALKNLLG